MISVTGDSIVISTESLNNHLIAFKEKPKEVLMVTVGPCLRSVYEHSKKQPYVMYPSDCLFKVDPKLKSLQSPVAAPSHSTQFS